MKAMVKYFCNWRIRKTKEKIAYWKAQANMWILVCSRSHMTYERDHMVEAISKQRLYEARLESLLSNDQTRVQTAKEVK
jgi:hypothetical protein